MKMGKSNCTISIPNYGAVRVKALRVVHGVSVVAYNNGGSSRHGSAFYPSKRTSGSFELTVQFTSFQGYQRVNLWLKRYMIWAGNPRTLATPVRVRIPDFDFDKVGALERGVEFGDRVAATSYVCEYGFVGAKDPMAMAGDYISRFRRPKDDDPALEYLYPAGTQLSGDQNGFDTSFDYQIDDTATGLDDTPITLPEITLPKW